MGVVVPTTRLAHQKEVQRYGEKIAAILKKIRLAGRLATATVGESASPTATRLDGNPPTIGG